MLCVVVDLMSAQHQGRGAHGRCSDANADTADGNWKLGADWKCTDMCSRLSDLLGVGRMGNGTNGR